MTSSMIELLSKCGQAYLLSERGVMHYIEIITCYHALMFNGYVESCIVQYNRLVSSLVSIISL